MSMKFKKMDYVYVDIKTKEASLHRFNGKRVLIIDKDEDSYTIRTSTGSVFVGVKERYLRGGY